MYERRQTDMKEKFTKPEIKILLSIVDVDNQNQDNSVNFMNDDEINSSLFPDEGGENWD